MKLAPDAVKARKERAKRDFQRVEARREESGNASLAGREMDTADVIASKAYIDALAAGLRSAGMPGTLDALRVRVLAELTQGRDPLDLISPAADPDAPAGQPDGAGPGRLACPAGDGPDGTGPDGWAGPDHLAGRRPDPERPVGSGPGPDGPGGASVPGGPGRHGQDDRGVLHRWGPGDDGWEEDPDGAGSAPRRDPVPLPALVNLLIPAGTWLGWSTAPGEAAGWGLLDRQETADLLRAAARHPRTRWCATLVGPDGTAVAHACARGQHPWLAGTPAPPEPQEPPRPLEPPRRAGDPGGRGGPQPPPGSPCTAGLPGSRDPVGRGGPDGETSSGPDPEQAARLAAVIARLGLTFRPIAKGSCDHAAAEDRYTPSRSLRHLARARTDRCDAPGCQAQALHGDLDHTIEYPAGITCECNLGPKCRRHHRCKQSPGWKLEQTEPGVLRWTLPSGRVHTTRPTVYDV